MNTGGIHIKYEIILIKFFIWCAREHFLVDLKTFSSSWKSMKLLWTMKLHLSKEYFKTEIQGPPYILRQSSKWFVDLCSGYYDRNDNDSVVFCHNDLKRANIMKTDMNTFDEKCKSISRKFRFFYEFSKYQIRRWT